MSAVDIEGWGNSSASLAARTNREVALAIPLLCFLSLLLLVGTVGNLLVILTYCRWLNKSTTNLFVFCLAMLDLVSCSFVLSVEFYNILNPYTFTMHYLCSIQKYLMFSLDLSSGYIIVCISFDRYLRIARPHQGLSVYHAKLAAAAVCLGSHVLCAIALFIYGTEEVRTADGALLGQRCGTTQTAQESILPLLFTTIILVCFGIAVIMLLVVYTRLGCKVKRWNNGRVAKECRQKTHFQPEESSSKWDRSPTETSKQTETFKFPPVTDTDIYGRTARAIIFKRPDYVRQISRSLDKCDFSKLDEAHSDGSKTLPYPKSSGARNSRTVVRRPSGRRSGIPSLSKIRRRIKLSKTTVMFIVATVAFVASHVPYVCASVLHVLRPDLAAGMSALQRSMYRFADYSFIISYGVNPLIYSFMNPKFRIHLTLALKCRRRNFYSR